MDPNSRFCCSPSVRLLCTSSSIIPGAVIPGTVGVVFILVAAFALNLLPTRFAALDHDLGSFCTLCRRSQVCHAMEFSPSEASRCSRSADCFWWIRPFPKCAFT